jgi:pSer/pThr/pTyr-binding forkhead associated (FHA) protein
MSLDVPLALIKDPELWSEEDVGVWLQWLGLPGHVAAFSQRRVDGERLLDRSAVNAWSDLGVFDVNEQQIMANAIEPLRQFQRGPDGERTLVLKALEGPLATRVLVVGHAGATGGRNSGTNEIVLSENFVSRRHFELSFDRDVGKFFLADVGSTTGTFLLIREPIELKVGLMLQMGTTEVKVTSIDTSLPMCTLVTTGGPDAEVRVAATIEPITLGRDAGNAMRIQDGQISSVHAEVAFDADDRKYFLRDTYSTNRTWLRLGADGVRSEPYGLEDGDLFKVGSSLFLVLAVDGDAEWDLPEPRPTAPPPWQNGAAEHTPGHAVGTRLVLDPETYAEKLLAARLRMHTAAARVSRLTSTASQQPMSPWSSMQQRMRNTKAQTAYALREDRREAADAPEGDNVCKICFDGVIDVVLYPCGHLVICQECAKKVSDCPICRMVICDVVKMYKA